MPGGKCPFVIPLPNHCHQVICTCLFICKRSNMLCFYPLHFALYKMGPFLSKARLAMSLAPIKDDSPSTDERRESFMGMIDDSKSLQLLHLPPEILLSLARFLNSSSKASARLACRALYRSIPAPEPPDYEDLCARTALHRHSNEPRNATRGKHHCALCKALYRDSLFCNARVLDPGLDFSNFTVLDPFCLAKETQIDWRSMGKDEIPTTRICSWHTGRFIFPPTAGFHRNGEFEHLVKAVARNTSGWCPHGVVTEMANYGWSSSVEPVCMHCGRVVVCVCSVEGCDMCPCGCDSCGVRRVRCWWKLERDGRGSPATREANFQLAKRRWLVTRAEMDMNETGTAFGRSDNLAWGAGRTVKCSRDPTALIHLDKDPT